MVTRAQISGIDYYLPQRTLDNNELARIFPEWSASKIEEKTGVRIRHIAAPHETAADMAVKAAQRLFEKSKCTPDDIDFVVLCTESPDYPLPPSACLIQDRLRIPSTAGALDYNLACSGFVYGLALAQGLIETGIARNVLLLTAETYTKYMHPLDRSVRTLFGDGSAATFIRGVESDSSASDFIGPFVFGTDGSGGEHLIVRGRGHRISESTAETSSDTADTAGQFPDDYLYMNGPAIFSFTLRVVPAMIRDLLEKSGLDKENIDLFIFHQASKFMLDALRRQVNIPPERFVIDLADKGNTVSSTLPIALLDAQRNGRLKHKARVMLVAFGVGLSWGATMAIIPGNL